MCSCTAPANFLESLSDYKLPDLPTEIQNIILFYTKSYSRCPECMRIVAQSINSDCKMHCTPFILCIHCST